MMESKSRAISYQNSSNRSKPKIRKSEIKSYHWWSFLLLAVQSIKYSSTRGVKCCLVSANAGSTITYISTSGSLRM